MISTMSRSQLRAQVCVPLGAGLSQPCPTERTFPSTVVMNTVTKTRKFKYALVKMRFCLRRLSFGGILSSGRESKCQPSRFCVQQVLPPRSFSLLAVAASWGGYVRLYTSRANKQFVLEC